MGDKPEDTPNPSAPAKATIIAMANQDYGPVIAQVKGLVEDHMVPKPIVLVDPVSGTEAPGFASANGIDVVPSNYFDSYLEAPRFRQGFALFSQIESLIEHVNRFKDGDSVLFATDDRSKPSIVAVIDYHRAGPIDEAEPRFGRHRSLFPFPLSDEWKAWIERDKKPFKMREFAAFLEDRIPDVLDLIEGEDALPEEMQKFVNAVGGRIASAAGLLEMSIGLKVNEKSAAEEAFNLSTGEATLHFKSEHVDGSGAPLKVPNLFLIAIPVFKNGQFYRLAARLRYRMTNEGLVFWYELWRADRAFDHAFADNCERAKVETGLPLLFGTPE